MIHDQKQLLNVCDPQSFSRHVYRNQLKPVCWCVLGIFRIRKDCESWIESWVIVAEIKLQKLNAVLIHCIFVEGTFYYLYTHMLLKKKENNSPHKSAAV